MTRRRGDRSLTEFERRDIRRLVAKGERINRVAAAVGRSGRVVRRVVSRAGGIPGREGRRSVLRLSLAEREEISRGLRGGDSFRRIALGLGRSPSTVSREVAANGGRRPYRAHLADAHAADRAHRPRRAKLARSRPLRRIVERLLEARWSPQQIARRLRLEYPDDPSCGCPPRRSTNRCSCRAEERCGRSSRCFRSGRPGAARPAGSRRRTIPTW